MKIQELVDAFDLVIPGYAWAWHDATASRSQNYRSWGKGWRDSRRRNLLYGRDRCLPIYGFEESGDGDYSIVVWNRGYVHLFKAKMPEPDKALTDLWAMRDTAHSPSQGYFTVDQTPFDLRCRICLKVLTYFHQNASDITPLWQNVSDLARTS